MPIKATDTWLRTNFVGLMIGLIGLIGTSVSLNSKLDVVVSDVAHHSEYAGRVQKIEKEYIQLKATQDAGERYWERFELLLSSNTNALNDNSAVMTGVKVQLDEHARRLDKIESRSSTLTQ